VGLCFWARPFIFLASKLSSFVATVTTRASECSISWKVDFLASGRNFQCR